MRFGTVGLLSMTVACSDPMPAARSSASAPLPSAAPPPPVISADAAMRAARRTETLPPADPLPSEGMPPVIVDRDARCRAGEEIACVDLAWLVIDNALTRAPARLAAETLRASCERGFAPACVAIADALLEGRGVFQDVDEAERRLDRLCETGEAEACARLGLELVLGKRFGQDRALGMKHLNEACDRGSSFACQALERRPWVLLPEETDDLFAARKKSREVRGAACAEGRLEACATFEWNDAIGIQRPLCTGGHHWSCWDIGKKQQVRAACAANDYRACGALDLAELDQKTVGRMCTAGIGKMCRTVNDLTLLAKACERGTGSACTRYRTLENDGTSPTVRTEAACKMGDVLSCALVEVERGDRDMTEARLAILARGCPGLDLQGDDAERKVASPVCNMIGRARRSGAGVTKDPGAALEAFRRSCWGNGRFANDEGCVAFGDMLVAGEGVAIDLHRARVTYVSACVGLEKPKAVACDRAKALAPREVE